MPLQRSLDSVAPLLGVPVWAVGVAVFAAVAIAAALGSGVPGDRRGTVSGGPLCHLRFQRIDRLEILLALAHLLKDALSASPPFFGVIRSIHNERRDVDVW